MAKRKTRKKKSRGAEVEKVVGGPHDGLFVFDNHEGIALVPESMHDADESGDVAGVEAYGGFVEDEEGLAQAGAEAGGEVDTLDFSAREGPGLAIEGEIAEADLLKVGKTGGDFGEDQLGGFV